MDRFLLPLHSARKSSNRVLGSIEKSYVTGAISGHLEGVPKVHRRLRKRFGLHPLVSPPHRSIKPLPFDGRVGLVPSENEAIRRLKLPCVCTCVYIFLPCPRHVLIVFAFIFSCIRRVLPFPFPMDSIHYRRKHVRPPVSSDYRRFEAVFFFSFLDVSCVKNGLATYAVSVMFRKTVIQQRSYSNNFGAGGVHVEGRTCSPHGGPSQFHDSRGKE